MTREELLYTSIGENIDRLVTIDMRGYSVPRILYDAARKYNNGSVMMNVAKHLKELISDGDYLLFLTGFVFEPHKKGELDGVTGTSILIQAILKAKAVKPIIVCEEQLVNAISNVLSAAGINVYNSIDELDHYPNACVVIGISTEYKTAEIQTQEILKNIDPKLIFSIEKPGRNRKGVYHQGTGIDVSYLCAKCDDLFIKCQEKGIKTFAIGDLGNEIGMGILEHDIRDKIPFGSQCCCNCHEGLIVETKADFLAVATTSDWACYGITAALAALYANIDLLPSSNLYTRICECANQNNLIDGSGLCIPSIDGIPLDFNIMLLEMLRSVVEYSLKNAMHYSKMYDYVIALNYNS